MRAAFRAAPNRAAATRGPRQEHRGSVPAPAAAPQERVPLVAFCDRRESEEELIVVAGEVNLKTFLIPKEAWHQQQSDSSHRLRQAATRCRTTSQGALQG